MKIESGSYRIVFMFKNCVIKIPKMYKTFLGKDYNAHKRISLKYFLQGIASNKKEIYKWHTFKDMRNVMCPILVHDILGLFLIMKRANTFTTDNLKEFNDMLEKYKKHPVFEDAKTDNIGVLKNKIVLIDYGGFTGK